MSIVSVVQPMNEFRDLVWVGCFLPASQLQWFLEWDRGGGNNPRRRQWWRSSNKNCLPRQDARTSSIISKQCEHMQAHLDTLLLAMLRRAKLDLFVIRSCVLDRALCSVPVRYLTLGMPAHAHMGKR